MGFGMELIDNVHKTLRDDLKEGTMESLQLRPIEKAKISCARKLFNEISTENVVYHDVDSYQSLLNIMPSIEKKTVIGGV